MSRRSGGGGGDDRQAFAFFMASFEFAFGRVHKRELAHNSLRSQWGISKHELLREKISAQRILQNSVSHRVHSLCIYMYSWELRLRVELKKTTDYIDE